jgi:hypothetical protein
MENSAILRLRPRFSLALLLVGVALCAGALGVWRFLQEPYVGPSNIHRIRPGMNRAEGAELMGERDDSWRDEKGRSYWEYYLDRDAKYRGKTVLIAFVDWIVVEVYKESQAQPGDLHREIPPPFAERFWRTPDGPGSTPGFRGPNTF